MLVFILIIILFLKAEIVKMGLYIFSQVLLQRDFAGFVNPSFGKFLIFNSDLREIFDCWSTGEAFLG
jgi:hypothetical protein